MNLLTAENLTKAYSEHKLFDRASFYLDQNEKVGIIGINGTGKSTLLKILAGLEETDEGTVTMSSNTVIKYLFQHPSFDREETALEYILEGQPEEDRWTLEAQAKSMLSTFGVDDFNMNVQNMSGGQRKKTALVKVLLGKTDLLILDEPTNHLDNDMTAWLENYLVNFRGTVVMVTHDRYFLDSVTDRIVEIDKGQIYSYKTNYSGFLQLKAEREDMAFSTDKKKANILRNELKWVMKGAQARSTKQKARLERYEELKSRKRPVADAEIELGSVSSRLGRTTIELHDISKAYGDKVLIKDFTYIFLRNDRIGFIGENGCGKTTLMKMILGDVKQDSGEIITGQTVKIGYYAQEITSMEDSKLSEEAKLQYMNPEIKVIDYIRNTAEYVKTKDGTITASQILEKFLFTPEKQYSLIKTLSGGEKRRLNLSRVLMTAPNILILDEPTNDLDISTLTILEDYLDSFDGIVITVSHDRYFLDRVVRRIFAFEGNGVIRQYEGGYTDYSIIKEYEGSDTDTVSLQTEKQPKTNTKVKDRKLKFSYSEQREFDTIENDIEELENKLEELERQMAENATNSGRLNELVKEQAKISEELDNKMERWEYLTELSEKIEAGQ